MHGPFTDAKCGCCGKGRGKSGKPASSDSAETATADHMCDQPTVLDSYLKAHDVAMAWAKRNRALIAHRFLSLINGEVKGSHAAAGAHSDEDDGVVEESDTADGDEPDQLVDSDPSEAKDSVAAAAVGNRCILDVWHNYVARKASLDMTTATVQSDAGADWFVHRSEWQHKHLLCCDVCLHLGWASL